MPGLIRMGISGLVLAALLLFSADVWTLARTIDARSRERETSEVRRGLSVLGEAIVGRHLALANGADSFRNLHPAPDAGWIKREFWPRADLAGC